MTHSEYAAIGRRVATISLSRSTAAHDRAVLWELCEALLNYIIVREVDEVMSRDAKVAALLESLGGTDG